jgi:hypothetical protein
VFAFITAISYAVIMVALLGFTWAILLYASGPWTPTKYGVAGGYAFVELVEMIGFGWPLVHPRFVYQRPARGLPH